MHQLKAAHRRNGGAVENLRQTLRTLLKTNYQAEAILQIMVAEATRLFPGLTAKDHQSIVSCVIENVAVPDETVLVPSKPKTADVGSDNVIPFPAGRSVIRPRL